MKVEPCDIPGPLILVPTRFADARGYLSEVYHEARFAPHLGSPQFVQENHIFSAHAGTIRGLHFQVPPKAQAKLVRVTRGAVWDVAVDLRQDCPSYGRHVGVTLSAGDGRQLFVPEGFAHGFCTLEPDCEVTYKVTAYYDPACERGLAWDDPGLAIPWPVERAMALLSERDRHLPLLKDMPAWFGGERLAT